MRKLLLLLGGVAGFLFAAEGPPRRVSVPREVLPLLLERGADRVMMPGDEYARLLAATRKVDDPAVPDSRPPLRVEVATSLEPDHVRVRATCDIRGLSEGWNRVDLPFEQVYWTSATIDGRPAELAGAPGGEARVFFQGLQPRTLRLEGVAPLVTDQGRQEMAFRVPRAPGGLTLQTGPETETKGLDVVETLSPAEGVRLRRVLPRDGWVRGSFSLNRLYRSEPRALEVRMDQHAVLSPRHEDFRASADVLVLHQPARRLAFAVPADLILHTVESRPASDWEVLEVEGDTRLRLSFPEDVIGPVRVELSGQVRSGDDGSWRPPDIRLVNADRSHRLQSVRVLEPLRVAEIDYGAAEPASAASERGYAWIASDGGAPPRIELRRREGRLEGFVTLMLQVEDLGLRVSGEVTLLPKGEGIADSRFRLPAEWRVETVAGEAGASLPFERSAAGEGQQEIRVALPGIAPPGTPVVYRFEAAATPGGWLEPDGGKRVVFPGFELPGADSLIGALAADAGEGKRLVPAQSEGLTPLDDRTRSILKFNPGDRVPGYRFESAGYGLELEVETLEPEIRVEATTFVTLEPSRVGLRYEWRLEYRRAPAETFTFRLPVELPRGVTPRLNGQSPSAGVTREADGPGGEIWTVPVAGGSGGSVHVVLESFLPFSVGDTVSLPLPSHPDTELQSGFFAVEGLPDVAVTLEGAPREVDLGELSGAEYRPGARLLGSYAYTGAPPGVEMRTAPRPVLEDDAARVRRLRLHTNLSVTGEAQTRAVFLVEDPTPFLALRLPKDAVCWSAEVNQAAVEPRRGKDGEWLVPVAGAARERLFEVSVVYTSTVEAPGFGRRQRMRAPQIALYDEHRRTDSLPPVETEWMVNPPDGLRMAGSRGTAVPDETRRPPLAAVETAGILVELAGGVRKPRDWLGFFVSGALKRSKRMAYDKELRIGAATEELGGDYAYDAAEPSVELMRDLAEAPAPGPESEPDPSRARKPKVQYDQGPSARQVQGYRSLKISFDAFEGSRFRSLHPVPEVDIVLRDEDRARFLALAAGVGVFALGLMLGAGSRRRRWGFVLAAMVVSALPGMWPPLAGWTRVFNALFSGAFLLAVGYILTAFLRVLWRPMKRPVILLLATLITLGARAEMAEAPRPLPIPADVVVEVRDGDGGSDPMLLVPRAWAERVRASIREGREEVPDASIGALGWLGGVLEVEIGDGGHLQWKGMARFRTRGEGVTAIPLPLDGAELGGVRIDGATARLRSRNGVAEVLIQEPGEHEMTFTLRSRVERAAGVGSVNARLPAIPGLTLRATAPSDGLRIEWSGGKLSRSVVTTETERMLEMPVPGDGRVRLRWFRPTGQSDKGGGLQADLLQVVDIGVDGVDVAVEVRVVPGAAALDRVRVGLPGDWRIRGVEGEHVGGWERIEGGDGIQVVFLREIREPVTLRMNLWRTRDGAEGRVSVPAPRVDQAVRQTGTVVVRSLEGLELRVAEAEQVRRVAMPDRIPPSAAPRAADARPVPYRAYGAHAPGFSLALEARRPEASMVAHWRGMLRVAEVEDRLEALCRVDVTGPKRFQFAFTVPEDLEVQRVAGPGIAEWAVEGNRLEVFMPRGVTGRTPVVIEGRFPKRGWAVRTLPDPRLEGAESRSGEWVVLTDPSVEVELSGGTDMRRIAVADTFSWLEPEQRPFVKLALFFQGEAEPARLAVRRLEPEVTVTSFANMRIHHQVIEETLLFDARIRGAGLKRFRARVPERFRDARVRAPLMREVVWSDAPGHPGWVEMEVELQDEVMDQLVILLERDRGAGGDTWTLDAPRSLTGRADGVYVTVENAGRDEIRATGVTGLDALTRSHPEWRPVADLLGNGLTFAYHGRTGGPGARISLERIVRERAATAGGRIGLSRIELHMDRAGSYVGRWTAWVDNRTEQTLHTALPEGARLVSASVAGNGVKALRGGEDEPNALRIPLVKTPRGEADVRVELVYAGSLDSFAVLRKEGFPFPESLNLPVDLSQATLHLPDTRRWFRFDGSMRQVEDQAVFQAGWLKYRSGLAERLTRTLQTGDVFEKARATYNLDQLKSELSPAVTARDFENPELNQQAERTQKALREAEEELKRSNVAPKEEEMSDNRVWFSRRFESQSNDFSRNQVLLNSSNWEQAPVEGVERGANEAPQSGQQAAYGNIQQVLRSRSEITENDMDVQKQSAPGWKEAGNRSGRRQQAAEYLGTLGKMRPDGSGQAEPKDAELSSWFPRPPRGATEVYRFTTPRGDTRLTAWSVSETWVDSLVRAAGILLAAAVLTALAAGFRPGPTGPASTWMLLLSTVAFVLGFLPVAAVVVFIWGLVLKMRTPAAGSAA